MLSPEVAALARIAFAGWFGLVLGAVHREWDDSLAMASVIFGIVVGAGEWLGPPPPAKGLTEQWKWLGARDRRRIARAVARGRAGDPGPVRNATPSAADAVLERRLTPWTVARLALLPAGVIFGALAGAPAGWLAVGAIGGAATLAAELWKLTRGRGRARRAAEATRRVTTPTPA